MPETPADAFTQASYQVRMEWGPAGLARLSPSDVVVLVDVFGLTALALADAPVEDHPSFAIAAAASGSLVIAGGMRNARAVARWIMAEQERRGTRTSIAVVAAGADRFAVEDQLGAGAVVSALGDLGIDHSSPEAAVAGEGFRALRTAARHLLTASGTGRMLVAEGRRDDVLAAAVDDCNLVPVLRAG